MVKRFEMNIISYSALRTHLASTLDKVNEDHVSILITRQNAKPAVIMSLEDYKSYEETAYLMASPVNAARLCQSIAEVGAARTKPHGIIEE